MTPTLARLIASPFFAQRTPGVRERLLRYNPDPIEGCRLRGYHPKPVSWRKAKRMARRGVIPYRHRVPGGQVFDALLFGAHPAVAGLLP
jgi:hypothetical protein